ncbi:MAG: hypothetical protein IT440_04465 [Phycisphaeraceae bacterium]|nr:hypothetical protein [Phycisphaeraceae bacterium]
MRRHTRTALAIGVALAAVCLGCPPGSSKADTAGNLASPSGANAGDDADADARRQRQYMEFERQWQLRRSRGEWLWGAQQWMRSREEYEAMDSVTLARDCFSRSILQHELQLFDDPRLGFLRVRAMHPGYAEWFARPDLWRGLAQVYVDKAEAITPKASLAAIVAGSGDMQGLKYLLTMPEIQERIRGREREIIVAQLAALRSVQRFMRDFDPKVTGSSVPFFCEPVSVAESALTLAYRMDPQAAARADRALKRITFSADQRMAELKTFVDAAVDELDAFLRSAQQP